MIDHHHGTLDRIVDTERRSLRPIGATAYEVAARTGEQLTALACLPGVRLYRGVRLPGHAPPIPYALSAGTRLVLVDTVAWPPGSYATTPGGAVLCDATYIGQSAHLLLGAVRRLRRLQPRGHRVTAVVVVHPSIAGTLTLPAVTGTELTWTHAACAVPAIAHRLRRHHTSPGPSRALTALTAATALTG
ncbi:hypothetical protein [Winogradskya humida]|uniref:Endonuclease V n=1 Tax=Winogradskya humida TaxID=113566 RepID=A0ABQ3ZY48_9ACTN|nr:hypothetical protein [Actinoplanes humidus]GIE23463.1 hypothetical protein Ahu01nite_065650 [Actinoplanes humidus]